MKSKESQPKHVVASRIKGSVKSGLSMNFKGSVSKENFLRLARYH